MREDISWSQIPLISIDTETTGQYPLESELCEVAAVKWQNGEVIETFQSLIKPSKRMSEEVISIHNITNEMVASAPTVDQVLPAFHQFLDNQVVVAHHAPFDLGFLVPEYEKLKLPLPTAPALCSSLLSRALIPESPNHKLQTLIPFLGLESGKAHRALDDAKACLEVALLCLEKLEGMASLKQVMAVQGGPLYWNEYSLKALKNQPTYGKLIEAIETGVEVQIVYQGGSRPGQARTVKPIGLVRNPKGDYLVARDEKSTQSKRYYLKRISAAAL